MTLPQACVTAIPRSSISSRLNPSWPPSEVATRFASPMNSPCAGILSSASWALAASGIRLCLLRRVLRLLPAAACGSLQLLTAPVRSSDAVVNGASYRVVGIECGAASCACQLDSPCAERLHLLAPWAGGERRSGYEAQRQADEKAPAEAAAALTVVRHLSISFGGSGGTAPSRPVKLRHRLLAPTLTPWRVDWVGPSERPTTSVSRFAPSPAARKPTFTAAAMSFTLPRLPRSSGVTSWIASSVVIKVSSSAARALARRCNAMHRNSATARSATPAARYRKFSNDIPRPQPDQTANAYFGERALRQQS